MNTVPPAAIPTTIATPDGRLAENHVSSRRTRVPGGYAPHWAEVEYVWSLCRSCELSVIDSGTIRADDELGGSLAGGEEPRKLDRMRLGDAMPVGIASGAFGRSEGWNCRRGVMSHSGLHQTLLDHSSKPSAPRDNNSVTTGDARGGVCGLPG